MRNNSIIKYAPEYVDFLVKDWHHSVVNEQRNFHNDKRFVFMGEIPNMPEHGIVMEIDSNKILVGIHIENYMECSKDEV